MFRSRGDKGSGPLPPENHKNVGFLGNTGPDPIKSQNYQASQHSMLGQHWHAKWRFSGRPIIARLKWYLDPSSPYHLKKKLNSKVGPPLAKLSGSPHAKVEF